MNLDNVTRGARGRLIGREKRLRVAQFCQEATGKEAPRKTSSRTRAFSSNNVVEQRAEERVA